MNDPELFLMDKAMIQELIRERDCYWQALIDIASWENWQERVDGKSWRDIAREALANSRIPESF